MKQKISGLLTVKSIVTLALTAVFCYLSIIGDISGDKFITIFTVIISFYFGTKHEQISDKIKEGVKKYDNRNQ